MSRLFFSLSLFLYTCGEEEAEEAVEEDWELPHAGDGSAPVFDNDHVAFDGETRDAPFGCGLVRITAQRTKPKERVQHLVGNATDGHFRDFSVARVAVRRRLDLKLAVEETSPKSGFVQRNADLRAQNVVFDMNKRLSPRLPIRRDELIDIACG